MKHCPRRRWNGFLLLLGLCLPLGSAAITGTTAARFVHEATAGDAARTAAFGVEVLPPGGIYTADELPDGARNAVEQANVDSTTHVFTVVNHGEVTVLVTPAAAGWKDSAWTLDTTPFALAPGEWREVLFTLEGGATGLTETVEDIDLILTIEQVD